MSFAHLHVHTEYSLLDGFSNIKKLMARAKEMEMPALAITDHGTMFGVIEFYQAAKEAGIKPIIGMETYMAARSMLARDPREDKRSSHLLLLAENETGYKNLLQIASTAQLEGFYYYPRIDKEFLARHAEGLICSTGCMSAEVPRLLEQGQIEQAQKTLDWYYEVFGQENFFLELQQHDIPELESINKNLLELGHRYDSRLIATNDVHYINPEDAQLQDILLAIQTGTILSDPDRMRMTDPSYYLRSPQEMSRLFGEIPEALANTLTVAERCKVNLDVDHYRLPHFQVPDGCTAETYLRTLCEDGRRRRYQERANSPVVQARLDSELGIIHQMGFDAYFLIVWDLCRYAREQGIWYNARGSAAGSIVAYCLDITLVDPLQHDLLFERFLNPGRISMPDIDLDFRDDRRAEMLEYAVKKYGQDKVAQIITFGTLGARAALRDVGRVMDIPLSEVDRVAKMVPNIPGKPMSLKDAIESVADLQGAYNSAEHMHNLIDTAAKMEGVVRNAGTHAAGVVISDKPIVEYLPLHRPTSNSEETPVKIVTQFEMGILEKLKMLKVDFLGLATLTIMARACDLIEQRHGKKFTLNNIPLDDPDTYKLMGNGQTAGVFQVEGTGMTRWLVQMKPTSLEHVIAMVALFRPGPMDFIPDYISRMHGETQPEYRHPMLEPIFGSTFGIPVYQEQLMRAAVELAGYSPSDADELRSAISKKKQKEIEEHRGKFVRGAVTHGIPEDTAQAIYSDWEEFARYGFNKCLPGDVEVIDHTTGRLVRIEDLHNGSAYADHTIACDIANLTLRPAPLANVTDNGVQPVYRLTTALGRSIEATLNHPFFANDGWKILDHLQIGDWIAVPRRIPVEGKQEWQEHEVVALGHLLAEGNLYHPHSVYFYSQDKQQVNDFIRAVEQFDNIRCSVSTHKSIFSVYAGRQDRKVESGIVTWAKTLGMWGKNAREKEIPAAAFELSNRQIGLLVGRMWDRDGHINILNNSVFYTTASERMARQLQHLLLRLGIISRLRRVVFPYKEGRTGWQLYITGYENLSGFAEKVGINFVSAERQRALKIIAAKRPDNVMGTKEIVPLTVKNLAREAKNRTGVNWMDFNAQSGIAQREFYPTNNAFKRGFSHETIGRLAGYFDDSTLHRLAENDVYWDEIVRIEFAGQKRTYDLEIPGDHNFIANDIIVHNSHAADYGVIAVQTAYLKRHYPAEYMTALLSVSKNQTEKVAFYSADTRNMGIEVLPPDVNTSEWDFIIEDRADGKPAIRFGLGAIKNVGQGAVELVIKARNSKPFADLNDFARRVDLRAVGKRALECLVKVGAMDSFGPRGALLASIELLVSISSSHFRAEQMGQMSLFGEATGVADQISLPSVPELDRRELLNWERELIGMYVSEHPLTPHMPLLTRIVSYFSAQLGEAQHEEKVRVAGLVTSIRPHQTKTGKMMGWVTIEDLQGNIELVLFPRTWAQYEMILGVGDIIIADGKVDGNSTPPKILVDTIRTEIDFTLPLEEEPIQPAMTKPDRKLAARTIKPVQALAEPKPVYQVASAELSDYTPPEEWDDENTPPPPDAFPPGWDDVPAPRGANPSMQTPPGKAELDQPAGEPVFEARAESQVTPAVAEKIEEIFPVIAPPPMRNTAARGLFAPVAEDHPPQLVTILLRPTDDKVRDLRRIQRLHGTFISYPGRDHFTFHIFEDGKGHLIEFPNDTTRVCAELLDKLKMMVGEENIRLELITYQ